MPELSSGVWRRLELISEEPAVGPQRTGARSNVIPQAAKMSYVTRCPPAGYWIFCGTRFARVIGLPVGQDICEISVARKLLSAIRACWHAGCGFCLSLGKISQMRRRCVCRISAARARAAGPWSSSKLALVGSVTENCTMFAGASVGVRFHVQALVCEGISGWPRQHGKSFTRATRLPTKIHKPENGQPPCQASWGDIERPGRLRIREEARQRRKAQQELAIAMSNDSF